MVTINVSKGGRVADYVRVALAGLEKGEAVEVRGETAAAARAAAVCEAVKRAAGVDAEGTVDGAGVLVLRFIAR